MFFRDKQSSKSSPMYNVIRKWPIKFCKGLCGIYCMRARTKGAKLVPCEMKVSTWQTVLVNKFCGASINANISFIAGPLGRSSVYTRALQET